MIHDWWSFVIECLLMQPAPTNSIHTHSLNNALWMLAAQTYFHCRPSFQFVTFTWQTCKKGIQILNCKPSYRKLNPNEVTIYAHSPLPSATYIFVATCHSQFWPTLKSYNRAIMWDYILPWKREREWKSKRVRVRSVCIV